MSSHGDTVILCNSPVLSAWVAWLGFHNCDWGHQGSGEKPRPEVPTTWNLSMFILYGAGVEAQYEWESQPTNIPEEETAVAGLCTHYSVIIIIIHTQTSEERFAIPLEPAL